MQSKYTNGGIIGRYVNLSVALDSWCSNAALMKLICRVNDDVEPLKSSLLLRYFLYLHICFGRIIYFECWQHCHFATRMATPVLAPTRVPTIVNSNCETFEFQKHLTPT